MSHPDSAIMFAKLRERKSQSYLMQQPQMQQPQMQQPQMQQPQKNFESRLITAYKKIIKIMKDNMDEPIKISFTNYSGFNFNVKIWEKILGEPEEINNRTNSGGILNAGLIYSSYMVLLGGRPERSDVIRPIDFFEFSYCTEITFKHNPSMDCAFFCESPTFRWQQYHNSKNEKKGIEKTVFGWLLSNNKPLQIHPSLKTTSIYKIFICKYLYDIICKMIPKYMHYNYCNEKKLEYIEQTLEELS